jgi:hypothetical protein
MSWLTKMYGGIRFNSFLFLQNVVLLKILVIIALGIYLLNYLIGWLIYLGKFKIKKRTHRIMFASLIFILVIITFFLKSDSIYFYNCGISLLLISLLPFSKNGGIHHRFISISCLLVYIIFFFLYFISPCS